MTFMKLLTAVSRVFSPITGAYTLFMRQGENQTFVLCFESTVLETKRSLDLEDLGIIAYSITVFWFPARQRLYFEI